MNRGKGVEGQQDVIMSLIAPPFLQCCGTVVLEKRRYNKSFLSFFSLYSFPVFPFCASPSSIQGRTGVMVSSYLLYNGEVQTAMEALQVFGEARTKNQKVYLDFNWEHTCMQSVYECVYICLHARCKCILGAVRKACAKFYYMWWLSIPTPVLMLSLLNACSTYCIRTIGTYRNCKKITGLVIKFCKRSTYMCTEILQGNVFMQCAYIKRQRFTRHLIAFESYQAVDATHSHKSSCLFLYLSFSLFFATSTACTFLLASAMACCRIGGGSSPLGWGESSPKTGWKYGTGQ